MCVYIYIFTSVNICSHIFICTYHVYYTNGLPKVLAYDVMQDSCHQQYRWLDALLQPGKDAVVHHPVQAP